MIKKPLVVLMAEDDERYIVKPIGFENFSETVSTISLFWQLVELPGGDHGPD